MIILIILHINFKSYIFIYFDVIFLKSKCYLRNLNLKLEEYKVIEQTE